MTPATGTPSATGLRHSQIVVDDSSEHFVQAGDPHAPPFVLLRGWPKSWRTWYDIMAAASTRVRAIAIDLPGIGKSTGAANDRWLQGFEIAGVTDVGYGLVRNTGHFAPEEALGETWRLISDFADRQEIAMAAEHDMPQVGQRAGSGLA